MVISIRAKTLFYTTVVVLLLLLLYLVRQILTPFILAAIFSYIFLPLINLFSDRLRIPRFISILFVFLLIIFSVVFAGLLMVRIFTSEAKNISNTIDLFVVSAKEEVRNLPDPIRQYTEDYLNYYLKNQFDFLIAKPFPFFSKAFFGAINFFVFVFSTFFLLKDYRRIINKILLLLPGEARINTTILLRKINTVLSAYLRGQIILILSMIIMLYLVFSILGTRFALTISVFSALFEIVPFIGPIVAAFFGTFLIAISGGFLHFSLGYFETILITLAVYYITRHIQDYFIFPFVFSHVTKLHPLAILFSVLVGEHLYGILGVILAIPVAASIKVIYEFILDKINEAERGTGENRE